MQLEATSLDWQVIDDVVMGGQSCGQVDYGAGSIVFSGALSTANNGGFSSIRGALPHPLRDLDSVRLRVKGDGRRYQFRLRESERPESPAWRAFFDTSGSDQSVVLRAEDFEAVIRGRRVEVLPGLQARVLRFAGLMLTAGEAGRFALELRTLELLSPRFGDD